MQSLTPVPSFLTRIFNTIDQLDRHLYNKRLSLFLWGCLLVLIIAPLCDALFSVHDHITYFATWLFFLFNVILLLAFVSSWRDDMGSWTWKRAQSRLQTYYYIIKDQADNTRMNSQQENLFKFGMFLFFGALVWKTFQNLSVFVRKPVESLFRTHLLSFRHFERFTNHYYWIPLVVGLGIIGYLYKKDADLHKRIRIELQQLFGWNAQSHLTGDTKIKRLTISADLVIHAKRKEHIEALISGNTSPLLGRFLTALQEWNPRGAHYEYEFQDRLIRHLKKNLRGITVESEYPIGQHVPGQKGRADIIVDGSILLELKRDTSAGAIQRAKGQVLQYSEIWHGKGPVILLLCNYEYEHAREAFSSTMHDLARLERNTLAIVAT